jgi:DNA-binding CsgD family transcriptional regulator
MKQKYIPLLILLLLLVSFNTANGAKINTATNQYSLNDTEPQPNLSTTVTEGLKVQQNKLNTDLNFKHQQTEELASSSLSIESTQKEKASTIAETPVLSEKYINGFWQGIFYGILALLIIINLVSFIVFDEKTYLLYGCSLVTLSAFLFFSDGLFAFFDIHTLYNPEIEQASFFLVSAIAFAVFGSHFLNLNTLFPKLKYVTTGIFTAAAITLISGWFLGEELLATISNVLAMTVVISYFISGVLLFNQRTYAKLYVIATVFPLLFIIDYLFSEPFSMSLLNIELGHLKVAFIAQIVLLTYAILYRMKEIKDETIQKQNELKIFLANQEMTAREKTERYIADEYLENVIMLYDLNVFEIKLLQYISEGKSNEKIARKLRISENYLEEATSDLYQKLEIGEQVKIDHNLVESQPDFIYN